MVLTWVGGWPYCHSKRSRFDLIVRNTVIAVQSQNFGSNDLTIVFPWPLKMRPLTEEESKAVFTKLANYIVSLELVCKISANWAVFVLQGKNLVHLIDRPDEPYCFRLHKDRVFYVSESSMKLAISVARPNLISLGTCFGKFSKSGKFKLHITCLDYLAQYAKYKVRTIFTRFSLQKLLNELL